MNTSDFGDRFYWGVATAAYQIEGGHDANDKTKSIWDVFTEEPKNIKGGDHGKIACDHFNRYKEDVALIKELNIPNYRFSISWSRILPNGVGEVDLKGVKFYHDLIDELHAKNIEPWVTLYHWDLPQVLQDKGGWTNRDIIDWFTHYVNVCLDHFGEKVDKWIVLNEPMVFTGAGHFLGIHAPGLRGMKNFIPAMHHATICQAIGGKCIKQRFPKAKVGTTFSCSYVTPYKNNKRHIRATKRMDALLNRLYIEPLLGLGYPLDELKVLRKVTKYIKPGDDALIQFDFDFIGIQNYTREVVKWTPFVPMIWGRLVNAKKRKVGYTTMEWEVYPPSIFHMLKKFYSYEKVKEVIVTENGAAFPDAVENGAVDDPYRLDYLKKYIAQVKKAKEEGVNVTGYFVWTLLDNFEWAEGFHQRFGLVHIDYETQKRTIKTSGKWYAKFLDAEN